MKNALVMILLSLATIQAQVKAVVKTTASGHSVTLSCTPSTTGAVTGYYFYRGTAAGGESTTALNATPSPTCGYTDTTVLGLTTYYYTAKSYDPNYTAPGLSVASNEVTAIIPSDAQPAPPTGLTVGTVAGNKVPLFWLPPTQQNGYAVVAYEVFRGTKPTLPNPSLIALTMTTSYTDNSCTGTCYYGVKAYTIKYPVNFVVSSMSNIAGN